jgi:hypothetical protein
LGGLLGWLQVKRKSSCRSPHAVSGRFTISRSNRPAANIGHQSCRGLVSAYDIAVNNNSVVLVDLLSETSGLP